MCSSTEDYNERMNKHYNNDDDDDEKTIPGWFYLTYCDECEKHREFVKIFCFHHRSHTLLVTCTYCQKDFKTFNSRQLRCSSCCRLIEQKLKTYTFENLKEVANVYNIKRRREDDIIDELVQKVGNYIL